MVKKINNMTETTIVPNCGNAPRKCFLRDYNIAFATGNAEYVIAHASDDITWKIHGDRQIVGKEAFAKEVNMMKTYTADELVIQSIITHGREAAVSGEIKMGEKSYSFCDVYRFTGNKGDMIKALDSFIIENKTEKK